MSEPKLSDERLMSGLRQMAADMQLVLDAAELGQFHSAGILLDYFWNTWATTLRPLAAECREREDRPHE